MTVLSTISIRLVGDTKDFENKMTAAQTKLSSAAGSMKSIGMGLSAAVTLPIIGVGVASISAASNVEESLNKVRVVFDESSPAVENFANTAASSLGMSEQSALEAAGTFGNLFTAMELAPETSAEMSTSLLTLAADLASFNNIDPTVALEKLRAGLVGEVEPLRTLGVNLSANAVKAKAFEMGLVEASVSSVDVADATNKLNKAQTDYNRLIKFLPKDNQKVIDANIALQKAQEAYDDALGGTMPELNAAQKAQAAYALIMEQTKNAQGDFARTSDGLANSQRILKANFQDTLAIIGQQFLPIVLQIVSKVQTWMKAFQELSPEQRKLITIIALVAAAIGPLLIIVGTLVGAISSLLPVIVAVAGVLTFPLIAIIAAVIAIIVLLATAWKKNWGGIQQKVTAVVNFIKNLVGAFLELLRQWWDEHGESVMAIVKAIWDFIKSIIQTVTNIVKAIIQAFLFLIKKIWTEHGKAIMEQTKANFEMIKNIIKTVLNIIGAIFDAFAALFKGDWKGFLDNIKEAWQLAWNLIKQVFANIKANILLLFNVLKTAALTIWNSLKSKLIEIWQNLWTKIQEWFVQKKQELLDMVEEMIEKFIQFFTETDWAELGRSIIDGIVAGLKNAAGKFYDMIMSLARGAWSKILDFFNISSPSKLTMFAGEMIVAGMAKGLENADPLIDALDGLGKMTASGLMLAANSGAQTTYQYNISGTWQAEQPEKISEKLRLLQMLTV